MKQKNIIIKKTNIITSILSITHNLFRCLPADVCKDVTFSGCPIENAHKIKKRYSSDAVSCQSACAYNEDCKYFRFKDNVNHGCSILSEDYRQDCNIFAAPVVRNA